MGKLGTGITLFVIGAILTFALHVNVPGLGENALGIILMLAGALMVGLHFVMDNQRRHGRRVVEERPVVEERRPVADEREVVEERPVVEERRRRRI